MLPLSIIILTRNEEKDIISSLAPIIGMSDDILVVDTGSSDNTMNVAKSMGATVMQLKWQGYSHTKNVSIRLAKYDWILSLDADEEINMDLKKSIINIFSQELPSASAFMIRRKLVITDKIMHFGAGVNEYRLRLFNRNTAYWNENIVHEDLEFKVPVKIKKLKGHVWHYAYYHVEEHEEKLTNYAHLFAKQKIAEGVKFPILKQYLSPPFGFLKNYIFRLGFLDGKIGLQFALAEMRYTFKKYYLINQFNAGHFFGKS